MESAIGTIIESGLLGALLVVSILTVGYLYREVKAERIARYTDLREIIEKESLSRNETKSLLNSILEYVRLIK